MALTRLGCFVALLAMLTAVQPAISAEKERPRLLVLTDIGGDPDDQQSLIRLMLYSNEFEIEGLIATGSGTPGEFKDAVTRPDLIREIVEAYGKVRPNLNKHAEGYPAAEDLLARIKIGNPNRGRDSIGESHDTEGSRAIIAAADRQDPRPLNITIWGGQTDLVQALWRVRNDRTPQALAAFLSRIRVFDIDDQDRVQSWIHENFPDLFYLLSKSQPGRDKREGAYRGMYLGGDESLTSLEWLDKHIRHGPLGSLYPIETWTEPNPHGALKEGDTPSWFYFRPSALQDPAHPEWGGMGGRFKRTERGLWRDVPDVMDGKPDPRASVWRWRDIFQRDFAARMAWARGVEGANHPPKVSFNGEQLREPDVVRVSGYLVSAGKKLSFEPEGTDRDGDTLSWRWWVYREAGTFDGEMRLEKANERKLELVLPAAASGRSIHLILELTDNGEPPLTTLVRIVLQCD